MLIGLQLTLLEGNESNQPSWSSICMPTCIIVAALAEKTASFEREVRSSLERVLLAPLHGHLHRRQQDSVRRYTLLSRAIHTIGQSI